MQFRFDCVFHYVSDLDRAIRFYTEVLGLELQSRDVIARFDIDGVRFELVPQEDGAEIRRGGVHVCLGVDDVGATRRWLQERGVAASEPQRVPGGVLATFVDPDGNSIYLWQNE